jgi:hypothetical protein
MAALKESWPELVGKVNMLTEQLYFVLLLFYLYLCQYSKAIIVVVYSDCR